ncbi:MAG: hypothetical protein KDC60_05125 [Bacteroidetes bacterium]|nr:hypothetical protein [Bacteroidota bacterium]MCB9073914.1 hypothetical protein [Chitinophagales bacterium]
MKTSILILFFIFTTLDINAHNNTCKNTLDSNSVVALLKSKGLILQNKQLSQEEIERTPSYQPKVQFNEQECTWEVSSQQYSTTKRGKCKLTNGCSLVKSLLVIVDAQTQKIIKKYRTKELSPNFE